MRFRSRKFVGNYIVYYWVGVGDGTCIGDAFCLDDEEIVGNSIWKMVFVISSSTDVSSSTPSLKESSLVPFPGIQKIWKLKFSKKILP